jgi:hypothetical protein
MSEDTDSLITFPTRLTDEDWDPTLSAWRCPALAIPKAEIRDLFVDGKRVDKANYQVLEGPPAVHWVPEDRPTGRIAAQIRLGAALSLESEKDRWKKLAIVLPVVASIVVALIGPLGNYLTKSPVGGLNVADWVRARINEWDVNSDGKFISFRLAIDALDMDPFIKKSEKDRYKLILGIRPRSANPHTAGQYENAFGLYSFDSTGTLVPEINDNLRAKVATDCVDLILFRVSDAALATQPFSLPFFPSHYGSDLKVADSTAGGNCL